MLKKLKELFPGIIALIVMILAVIWILRLVFRGLTAVWIGTLSLINTISTLDTVLVIALISGTVTILGLIVNSIISVALKTSEYRNRARAELRIKMERPYSEFVSLIFDIMIGTKMAMPMSEEETMERTIAFSKEVTLCGSNKVVKKWATYRTSAGKLSATQNLEHLEGILFAIREDLGFRKGWMKKGDILSLFINDIQDVFNKKKEDKKRSLRKGT